MFGSAFAAIKIFGHVKQMIAIPLILCLSGFGIYSCNSVLSTFKGAGAMEVENQVLRQAQEHAHRQATNTAKVAKLHEKTSKNYYEQIKSIEDQHRAAVEALHDRLLNDETGETCRNCKIP